MSKRSNKEPTPDRRMDGEYYDAIKTYLEEQKIKDCVALWMELQKLPKLAPEKADPNDGDSKKPALVPDSPAVTTIHGATSDEEEGAQSNAEPAEKD